MPRRGGSPLISRFTLSLPGGRSCAIAAGSGAVLEAPDHLSSLRASRFAIITDSNIEPIHGARMVSILRSAGLTPDLYTFPAGERSKTRSTKESLEDRMIASGIGRDSAVVALGGGVTGDLAGFVAATYMRGVPLVQVPTSLLAMADAAIGGKTGVDHPSGKNLIGAFHHPAAVLADTDFLATLPEREHRTGLAEIVKAGVVADAGLFDAMEASSARLAGRDASALEAILPRAIAVKIAVVAADERESDLRKTLNFGHTIGHALEIESGYTIPHGEAVSIGMMAEAGMAVRLGLLAASEAARIEGLLRALGLPVGLAREIEPARLIEACATDKKARGGRIEFVLPDRIGGMARSDRGYARSVPDQVVRDSVESLRSGR